MKYHAGDQIRGLIFDFDGTIVDSMPVHFLSWKSAFGALGESFSESFFYKHAGVSLQGVVQLYNVEYGTSLDPAVVVAKKDEAHAEYLPQTKVIPTVFDVIQRYYGVLPMAVATGNSKNLTQPLMERLDLTKYFNAVVFGDDVVQPKPHPECFLTAAEAIRVAPSFCEVFEDGEAGIEGARRAGMHVTDIRSWLK
ncbi:MAG: HAD-IA family hydrolase [Deltaproteobacteria bacterium]|nr:HAD-IA family hydrolase [Deltaproteobacteria bacterium]MBN2671326.1 HAD-IA family hydrolase [Deltaproteobacteria bacterium]